MNDLRASGGTRNLRTSTKSNEMPRELGICCEKCNNRLVELKRQVMRLILPEIQGVIQSQKKTKNVVSLFIQLVNFGAPWEKVCGKKLASIGRTLITTQLGEKNLLRISGPLVVKNA